LKESLASLTASERRRREEGGIGEDCLKKKAFDPEGQGGEAKMNQPFDDGHLAFDWDEIVIFLYKKKENSRRQGRRRKKIAL